MAETISLGLAQQQWAASAQGTSFSTTALYVKLHIGAPGAAGTGNPAAETRRITATACFTNPLTDNGDGTATGANTAEVGPLTSVTAAETYTHFSVWDASTAGNFQWSGTLTSTTVAIGDNVDFPIGALTVTIPIAS